MSQKNNEKQKQGINKSLWIEAFIIYCLGQFPEGLQKRHFYTKNHEKMVRRKYPITLFKLTFPATNPHLKNDGFDSSTGMGWTLGPSIMRHRLKNLISYQIVKLKHGGNGKNDYWYVLEEGAKALFFPKNHTEKSEFIAELVRVIVILSTKKNEIKLSREIAALDKKKAKEFSCFLNETRVFAKHERRAIQSQTKRVREFEEAFKKPLNSPEFYNQLAVGNYKIGNQEEALRLWKTALNLFKEKGDKKGESICNANIGVYLKDTGKMDKALRIFTELLKVDREIGYKEGEAICLANIGSIFGRKGDLNQGLRYRYESLMINCEIGCKEGEANQLLNIGTIYYSKTKLDLALAFFEEALKVFEHCEDIYGAAFCIGNIGSIYAEKGEIDKALNYYRDALEMCREIQYEDGHRISFQPLEASQLKLIGAIYRKRGDNKEAHKHYRKALKITRKIGDKQREASTLLEIGIMNRHQKHFKKALKLFHEALNLYCLVGSKNGEARCQLNIGLILAYDGEFDGALECFEKSLEIYHMMGDDKAESETTFVIGEIYLLKGDLKTGLDYWKKSHGADRDFWFDRDNRLSQSNLDVYLTTVEAMQEKCKHFEENLGIDCKLFRKIYLEKRDKSLFENAVTILENELKNG